MLKQVRLSNDVEQDLKALPRAVLRCAVEEIKALRKLLDGSAFLRQSRKTYRIDSETASISFFMSSGDTLNILRIVVANIEADNVIWLVSHKKHERQAEAHSHLNLKRKAGQTDQPFFRISALGEGLPM